MSEVNIKPITDQPLEGQSAAIENLNVSESTGVDRSVVDNQKSSVKRSQLTADTASEGVARTMTQSRDIASAIAPEVPKLSSAEVLGKTTRLTFEGSDAQKRRTDLALQVMDYKSKNPDKPVPDDIDLELTYFREEYNRINQEIQTLEPSLLTEGAAAMLSSFRDTAKSVVDNWEKVAGATAAGAGLGATLGSATIPLVGTFTGLVGGGLTGAAVSTLGVSALDNVRRMTGETYDELSTLQIEGKPANISEENKRYISYAVGALGGAVEYGLERFGLSKIPGLRGVFNPTKVKNDIISNPRLADTLIQFGKGIGANMLGEGTVEGVQYNLDVFAEELGKSWDGSQTSVLKALDGIRQREDYLKGLSKQVTVGAIAGGTGAVVLGTPGVAQERVVAQINQNRRDKAESVRIREQVEMMTDDTSDNGTPSVLTPTEQQPKIVIEEGKAKFLNSQQSLTLAVVLQNTAESVKDTKIEGQLSTAVELQKNMLEQSGVNQVWVSSDDLAKWADTQKKREKLSKWFGVYDPDLDTRLPVDVATLSEIITEDPEFSKIARPTVDGLSFNELLEYYKDRPERINRDFVTMGVAPSQAPTEITAEGVPVPLEAQPEAEPEAPPTAGLGPSSTDEDILATLGDRQAANEYLGRLQDEESKLVPLFHGTSAKFDKLDPSISGGMVNFTERPSVAEDYASSSGGGRQFVTSNNDLYIEAQGTVEPGRLDWNPETKSYDGNWEGQFLSVPLQDVEDFVQSSGSAVVRRKSARIIEASYDPSKVLDITKSVENNNLLADILRSLPQNKIAQAILEQSERSPWDADEATTRNLSTAWWGLSKMASYERTGVSPTINQDFKDIVAAIKNRGYEGLRFNDDSDTTVALFDPPEESRLTQIQQMRERVTGLIDQLPEAEPDLDSSQDITLDEEVELAFQEFASRPIYTDLIRAGVNPTVVQMLEREYGNIRADIIQATRETAYEEMVTTAKITDEIKKTEDAIEAIEASLNDPNIQIVDTFLQNLNAMGAELQVNPESLTPEQRNKYLEDPVLEARGIFNKYGKLTLNDLAVQMGVSDPEYALSLLQRVPDLDKVFKDAQELTKLAIDTEILDSTDYNNTAIIKALEKKQKLDAQAFNLLVQSSWAKARRGVEGTIFAKINLEKIKQDTSIMLSAIPTGKLNPNVYARSSKRAGIKKVKASLRGDFLEAARQREIEIRADEAYKQSLILKAKANRMNKKLGRWSRDRSIAQMLKDAKMFEGYQDLSKLVNLDKDAPQKNGEFEKVVKKAIEDQVVDMSIPQELINELNPAATPSELSFDQLAFIYNKHAEMIKQARDYSQVQVEQEKLYIGEVGQTIVDELKDHPDADPRRLDPGNKVTTSAGQRLSAMLNSVGLYMNNINFITLKLSQMKENSFIRKFIYDQLKGTGVYDTGYGEKSALKERVNLRKLMTKINNKNGRKKRIEGYAKDIITPVEFYGTEGLVDSRGEMTKLQLMTALLYYGTHTGRQRLGNFKVNPDTFLQVAEKYLTQDDIDAIQDIWDSYDGFKGAIKRMVEEIRGQEVEFVEGAAFTFKGKDYRGGYVPLRYRKRQTVAQASRQSDKETNVAVGIDKEIPYNIEQAEAFTKQGNLISRVKNVDAQLNLDWNYVVTAGFEDIIMQTTMHVPILNIMRLLNRNKDVADAMTSTLGPDQFQELKNHIIGVGKSHISQQLELNSELAEAFKFGLSPLVNSFVKYTLIGVQSTAILQLSSGIYAWHSQGVASTPRYLWNVVKLMARPHLIPEAVRLASELDPSIGTYLDNIVEDSRGSISDIVAKDLYLGSPIIGRLDAKIVRGLGLIDTAMTNVFLGGILGTIDTTLKVPAVLTMYENFKNGKVKGFGMDVLSKMSQAEIEREARAYATRTSQATLTATSNIEKAKAQRVDWLRNWTRYFNDVRNIYNYTMLNTFTKTRWALNKGLKDLKNGNLMDATMQVSGAAIGLITYHMYATVAATIISTARGRGTDEDDEEIQLSSPWTAEWEKEVIQTTINNFTDFLIVPKNVVGGTPILRDVVFSTEVREATGDRVKPIVAPMDVSVINIMVDSYRAAQAIWVSEGEFSDKELVTLLKGLSTVLPIPYRAIDQYMKSDSFFEKIDDIQRDPGVLIQLPGVPVMVIDSLIQKYKNNPDVLSQLDILKKAVDPNNATQITEITNGSEQPLTDYETEIIKFAESGGNPNAKAKGSGAYGLYQFTESTWNGLVNQYGKTYGLTSDGRKSSVEQQEKAFKLLTRDNARELTKAGIKVDVESIYAAHHFGISKTKQILKLPDTAKLPELDDERVANPWLNGDVSWINGGKRVKTVGDFKQGIKDLLGSGESKYVKSLNLDLD